MLHRLFLARLPTWPRQAVLAVHLPAATIADSTRRLATKVPNTRSESLRKLPKGTETTFQAPQKLSPKKVTKKDAVEPGDAGGEGAKVSKKSKVKVKVAKKPAATRLEPPKRPSSILQLITEDLMKDLRAKQGKLTRPDTIATFRRAGDILKGLAAEEKHEYENRLSARRKEHAQALASFIASLTSEDYLNQTEYVRQRKAKGRSVRFHGLPRIDPSAPKKPLNGFIRFSNDIRHDPRRFEDRGVVINWTAGSGALTEGSQAISKAWRELPEDIKADYQAQGQADTKRYHSEKLAYDEKIQKDRDDRAATKAA